jgi:hypothetical protein
VGGGNTPNPTPSNSPYSYIGDVDDTRGPDVGFVPSVPSNPWTINAAGLAGATPTLGATSISSDAQPGSVVNLTIVAAISTGYDFGSSLSVVLGNGTDDRFQLVGTPTLAVDGSQLTFTVRDTNTPSVGGSSTISFFIVTEAEATGSLNVTSDPPALNWSRFQNNQSIYYTATTDGSGMTGSPIITGLPSWLTVASNTGVTGSSNTGYVELAFLFSPTDATSSMVTIEHAEVDGEEDGFTVSYTPWP